MCKHTKRATRGQVPNDSLDDVNFHLWAPISAESVLAVELVPV